jgi:protein OS-9
MIFLLSLALALSVAARFHRSLIPEDLYAFPKFHVAFLNSLPLSNDTAQRWLSHGLQGGELEFMGEPWLPSFKEIDGSSQVPPRLLVIVSPQFPYISHHRDSSNKVLLRTG